MQDKFQMSQQDCVLFAKRNVVDLIYKESRLEGIAVTFPDTQEIYEGRAVAGLSVDDVVKVNNLKHAWQFVFDTIGYDIDVMYLRQLNHEIGAGIVTDAGDLRRIDVAIGGTLWKPALSEYDVIKNDLSQITDNQAISVTERATELMLYIMRTQAFMDGNKRTAQLAANQYMITNGAGIISIPPDKTVEFSKRLIDYYESGNMDHLKSFVQEYCLDGYNRVRQQGYEKRKNGELIVYDCKGSITDEIADSARYRDQTLFLSPSTNAVVFRGNRDICIKLEGKYGGSVEYVGNMWTWKGGISDIEDLENFTAALVKEIE